MAGLLSLSTELLIHVFSSCTTIESAASLSRVDKTLNSVWRKYNNHIATNVLQQQIPEYADAVDLAILEDLWINGNSQLASTPFTKLPVHLYGKQLLKIAKLAMSATAASTAYTRGNVLTFAPDHISLHAAYYLMRKIALAYLHPEAQLQDGFCKTLRSYSKEDVSRIDMFCLFLTDGNADLPERQTHDIDKPLSEWTQEDEWGYVTGEPWNYVDRVIQAVRNEERRGRYWLEKVLGTHVNMVRPSNT
jgi:hypothetical protein